MPCVQAVLYETLRCHPTVKMSLSRIVSSGDAEIDGHCIPAWGHLENIGSKRNPEQAFAHSWTEQMVKFDCSAAYVGKCGYMRAFSGNDLPGFVQHSDICMLLPIDMQPCTSQLRDEELS